MANQADPRVLIGLAACAAGETTRRTCTYGAGAVCLSTRRLKGDNNREMPEDPTLRAKNKREDHQMPPLRLAKRTSRWKCV